jgi:hypothetical protein
MFTKEMEDKFKNISLKYRNLESQYLEEVNSLKSQNK